MSRYVKRVLYSILFIVVLIAGLLFFVKNNQPVEFNYIAGVKELPVSILLLSSLCAGVLLGLAASVPVILRLKQQKSRLEKQIRVTEKEINNLRVLPLRNTL
jgi:putative membrane protein